MAKYGSFLSGLLISILVLLPGDGWAQTPGITGQLPPAETAPNARLGGAKKAGIQSSYGRLPLYFIKNSGQADKKVRFYEKGAGHATFFTDDGVYLTLTKSKKKPAVAGEAEQYPEKARPEPRSELVKLSFLNADKNPEVVAEGLQEGKVSYFIGNDSTKWEADIPTYSAVVYKDAYRGIDIRYYGNNAKLEYDIIVKPGSDPRDVKFSYEGIRGLKATDDGDLEIILNDGVIIQKKPYVFQEIDGKRVEVEGRFVILPARLYKSGGNTPSPLEGEGRGDGSFSYGFSVASYDRTRELIIDPVLLYSTYLGGGVDDYGFGIAVDGSGNAYVTGYTTSSYFPTASPIQAGRSGVSDVFVTKLNASGTALVYSTYLGGNNWDYGTAIAVDSYGNAYLAGFTISADFPTAFPIYAYSGSYDAFIAKINPSGTALVYSTYLGGGGDDSAYGIALDSYGNAYVTGSTSSADFPTANPIYGTCGNCQSNVNENEAFVTKINADGTALVYSTYLGGTGGDWGHGIAVDSYGNVYVTGQTYSLDFPTFNPVQASLTGWSDAFASKINAMGTAVVWSTYLGGSEVDLGRGIAVDSFQNAYITGGTSSPDFQLLLPLQGAYGGGSMDAFITKINSSAALAFSTYIGGSGNDLSNGIALDGSGNIYISGLTDSLDFPTAAPIYGTNIGNFDVFVTKIGPSGSNIIFSTYLGGTGDDFGCALAVDPTGNAYITGYTLSVDFPTTFMARGGGYDDAFIAKIGGLQTFFEDNDPAIVYAGLWNNVACGPCSAGNIRFSGVTGAAFDFAFNGTGIKWVVVKGPSMGRAKIALDGVPAGMIDLYAPSNMIQVLTKLGLAPGPHTLRVEVAGVKNPISTGYRISIDSLEVVP